MFSWGVVDFLFSSIGRELLGYLDLVHHYFQLAQPMASVGVIISTRIYSIFGLLLHVGRPSSC